MKIIFLYLATILVSGYSMFAIRSPSYAEAAPNILHKHPLLNKNEVYNEVEEARKSTTSEETVYVSITG